MTRRALAALLLGTLAVIALADASGALAQTAAPATQNTVTTTGPVTSDTTISVGTWAGQALMWVLSVFAVPIGTLATAVLWQALKRIGVSLSDASRARLQELVINGLNLGAAKAAQAMAGKLPVDIKSAAVNHAIAYVQAHGVDELHQLGIDPQSNIAVDAIKARIETAITDVNTPTPKSLDAPAKPAGSVSPAQAT
jgi:hypothetical protein